jgi:multidrug efflux pump
VRGVSLFLNPVQDLQAGGRQTNSTYQYVLKADHADVLQAAGQKLVDALKTHPDLITDVDIDQQDAGADAFVEVDRDAAARLGIPMQTVDATLYDAFGQRQVANIYSGLNQYHVVMEADRQFNGSPEALNNIYLPVAGTISSASSTANLTGSGGGSGRIAGRQRQRGQHTARTMTPLSAIARWNTGSTDASVSHSDGEPSATISFNLPQGVSLGQASALIAQVQASLALPATVHGEFGGTAKVFAVHIQHAAADPWRRWWRSISYSASFMKARSTRSPRSPPFPRPGWAQ